MFKFLNTLLLIGCGLATLSSHGMHQAASIAVCANTALVVKRMSPLVASCSFHTVRNVPKNECYKAPFVSERKNFYKQLKAKPWGAVSEKYINDFQQESHGLMRNLCDIAPGMTPVKWQIGKFYAYPLFQEDEFYDACQMAPFGDKHSALLSNRIKVLVQDVGIDPIKIKTVYDEYDHHGMAAGQSMLIVCNYDCRTAELKKNNDAIDACILHEIQHILHDDAFLDACLGHLYQENKDVINEQEFKKFTKKVCHMREKRADIFAGLVQLDYAQASMHGFKRCALFENADSETHPANCVRAKYLEKLHQEMLKDVRKK